MANIHTEDLINHDRELVYTTFREDLKELLPHLPDIEDIEVKSYDRVDDDTVEIVNVWSAKEEEIPKLAQRFIDPDMLQWTDHATWHDDRYECDWRMEVNFLKDAIDAQGTNQFVEKGDKARIIIDGEIEVDASEIPGVPSLMAGKVGDIIENFVVKLIEPNLSDVNRGLEKYLDVQE